MPRITLNVTPDQITRTSHLIRVITSQLEKQPAARQQLNLSLKDIQEVRKLNNKLKRAANQKPV